ncbi:MAG: hypothetical protein DBY32_01140 [Phascolarctobacterium sp.]|nr:MAG: hypothetical protein DBY32_01140 [Phascolarctobacterium sp.]
MLILLIIFLLIAYLMINRVMEMPDEDDGSRPARKNTVNREFVRYPVFDGTEKKFYRHVKDFTVIDFETANKYPDSICSIGIAVVKNNKIAEQQHWYVKPPYGKYEFDNTPIHGIKYQDVESAPTFADYWPTLLPYISHQYVAAYNARFDIGCLEASLKRYNIPSPGYGVIDILQTARFEWSDFKNHKLITVAKSLNIPHDPHNALSDATAAATVLIIANNKKNHKAQIIYKFLSDNDIDKMEEIFKTGQQFFKKARDLASSITSTNVTDYTEVFRLLQNAINTSNEPEDKNAKLYRFYGELYEKCGNKPYAMSYYQVALSLDEKVGVKQKLNRMIKEYKNGK